MDVNKLKELRRKAEDATSDMPDGELRLRAFQVILDNLLRGTEGDMGLSPSPGIATVRKRHEAKPATTPTSTRDRTLALKGEGFFAKLRSIGEIREQLASRGWHYPLTSLSGPLQRLVQTGELRRQKVSEGGGRLWKYSNP